MRYLIFVGFNFIISICLAQQLSINKVHARHLLDIESNIFTSKNINEKYNYRLEKVEFLMQNKLYKDAINELAKINTMSPLFLSQQNYYKRASHLCFQNGLYSTCIDVICLDTIFDIENSFLKLLCYNELESLEDIRLEISKMPSTMLKDTANLFRALALYQNKKYNKYLFMQALLPGLGMSSMGYYRKGITSFALNTTFALIILEAIKSKFYLSAFSFGFAPLFKFYSGGLRHVSFLIEKKRMNEIKKIKQHNAVLLNKFIFG